jgi:hypothetical protein
VLFKKIAGPLRIDSLDTGGEDIYELSPSAGGRLCKTLQYMVKVIKASATTTRVAMDVEHGPDGDTYCTLLNDVVPYTTIDTMPKVIEGHVGQDGDPTLVVGEWIRPKVKIKEATTSGPVWALIEVYEMRKAF